VGRFLRGLNAVFNAAIAIKRIDAELAIIPQFHSTQLALQAELIRLANIEVGDAIRVLSEVPGLNVSSLNSFQQASTQLNIALLPPSEAARVTCWEVATDAEEPTNEEESDSEDAADSEVESEDADASDDDGEHGNGHGHGHGGDSSDD